MTQTPATPPPARPRGVTAPSRSVMLWRSQTRRDQLFFGVLALVLLVISALLQKPDALRPLRLEPRPR